LVIAEAFQSVVMESIGQCVLPLPCEEQQKESLVEDQHLQGKSKRTAQRNHSEQNLIRSLQQQCCKPQQFELSQAAPDK